MKFMHLLLITLSLQTVVACDTQDAPGNAVESKPDLAALQTELSIDPQAAASFITDPCRYLADHGVELSLSQQEQIEEAVAAYRDDIDVAQLGRGFRSLRLPGTLLDIIFGRCGCIVPCKDTPWE